MRMVLTAGFESIPQETFTVCLIAALITVDSARHTGGSAEPGTIAARTNTFACSRARPQRHFFVRQTETEKKKKHAHS